MESWLLTLCFKRRVLPSYLHKATFSLSMERVELNHPFFLLEGLEGHYEGLLQAPSSPGFL